MPQNVYRIRTSFLIPLTIDVVLLFVLIILSCLMKGSSMERAVLAVFLILTFFILIEAYRRTITIGDEGLKIKKFFKIKAVFWSDITHIGCLVIRGRAYILLTTTKGFYILSNAYDRFSQLVRDFIEHIPSETIEIEEEARVQIQHPVHNVSDLIAAWIAASVLTGIICLKLIF